jgi:GPI transamidase subunit PIG-U
MFLQQYVGRQLMAAVERLLQCAPTLRCTAGSAVHAPPLLIVIMRTICDNKTAAVLPFILCDVFAAVLLYRIARAIAAADSKPLPISPATIAAIYLWNPCTVLTAAAESSATFMICSIFLALHAAVVRKSAMLAALGCALAVYLDACSVLFLLPVAMLLACGVENVLAAPCEDCVRRSYSVPVDVTVKHGALCDCTVCVHARSWRSSASKYQARTSDLQSKQSQVTHTFQFERQKLLVRFACFMRNWEAAPCDSTAWLQHDLDKVCYVCECQRC